MMDNVIYSDNNEINKLCYIRQIINGEKIAHKSRQEHTRNERQIKSSV